MAHEFKAGDVVMLKSGGPRMTVIIIESGNVYCNWLHDNILYLCNFPTHCLNLVRD